MAIPLARSPPTRPGIASPSPAKDLLDSVGGCAVTDANRGRVVDRWGQLGFLHWLDPGDMEGRVDPHGCWWSHTNGGRIHHLFDLYELRGQLP